MPGGGGGPEPRAAGAGSGVGMCGGVRPHRPGPARRPPVARSARAPRGVRMRRHPGFAAPGDRCVRTPGGRGHPGDPHGVRVPPPADAEGPPGILHPGADHGFHAAGVATGPGPAADRADRDRDGSPGGYRRGHGWPDRRRRWGQGPGRAERMSRSSLVDGMAARMGVRVPELPPGQPGDPGLFGPGSVVWVVGRERALLAGGQAALLLQLAHPLVAAGVGDHSRFRDDPMARLRTTLEAVLAITFGDLRQCKRAAAGVRAVHRRVSGSLPQQAGRFPAGTTYDAADPDLALWVHATLVVTALDTFDRFVGPLNQAQRTRYFDETVPFAGLFGAGPEVLPATYQHFVAYVDSMLNGPDLTVSPVALHAAHQVLHPPLPRGLRPMAWAARFATTALLSK